MANNDLAWLVSQREGLTYELSKKENTPEVFLGILFSHELGTRIGERLSVNVLVESCLTEPNDDRLGASIRSRAQPASDQKTSYEAI